MGYLIPKPFLVVPIAGGNKRIQTFDSEQLEFKLTYYNVAVQHVSHYATRTTSKVLNKKLKLHSLILRHLI